MILYFVIKKQDDDKYKMYTNTIFDDEKKALKFAKKSLKRNKNWKVIEFNKENCDKYWY